MASFLIVIHSDNYASQSTRSALQFAQAVVQTGHQLKGIFLYQQAVNLANQHIDIPSDELDNRQGFIALKQQHAIPLLMCVTAGEKRGVTQSQVESHFTIAGLAEMAEIACDVDRLIQFK